MYEQLGMFREITGRRGDCVFMYDQYMKMLSEGTKPLR